MEVLCKYSIASRNLKQQWKYSTTNSLLRSIYCLPILARDFIEKTSVSCSFLALCSSSGTARPSTESSLRSWLHDFLNGLAGVSPTPSLSRVALAADCLNGFTRWLFVRGGGDGFRSVFLQCQVFNNSIRRPC